MTNRLTALTALFSISLCAAPGLAAPVMAPDHAGPAPSSLHLAGQGDYLCEARLFGKKARLWLEAEMPVRYQWSNRPALAAEMQGDTITIAASPPATLSNVRIGKTADGQKAIQGDWKFKTNTQDGVIFTCAPE